MIVMAEGLAESFPQSEIRECVSESAYRSLKPDTFGHFPVSQLKYSGRIGQLVAEKYKRRTGKERKIVGLQSGYEVRCHKPTAFDVILGSQLGVGAYRELAECDLSGVMISVTRPIEPRCSSPSRSSSTTRSSGPTHGLSKWAAGSINWLVTWRSRWSNRSRELSQFSRRRWRSRTEKKGFTAAKMGLFPSVVFRAGGLTGGLRCGALN